MPENTSDSIPRLRIRMYRHGLGDCLLLRFRNENGDGTFNLLIDCGLIMVAKDPKNTMCRVANDIAIACDHRIDVVVMTHEHWDHVSGFSSQQAREIFDNIDVGEVWYAWTEDPQNILGKKLRKEREEKVRALASAVTALNMQKFNEVSLRRADNLSNLLGFFGLDIESSAGGTIGKTRDAFDYLKNRKKSVKTRYCYPEKPPISFSSVPNVRVYVLGPPQDEVKIKKSSPSKKDSQVYELAPEIKVAIDLESAFLRLAGAPTYSGLDDCPFDPMFRRRDSSSSHASSALDDLISETWDSEGNKWRQIEDDWTQSAETLALNLDSHTNNTCLVLAFEFIDSGEVFLFPADAQVGNWLSWQTLSWEIKGPMGLKTVTGPDLLSRTVFYKVGHHGSHNATLRTLGLEQMTHEDLVAFVPVFREQAEKNRWMGMPFAPLVNRLHEKTGGRLLFSDKPIPTSQELKNLSANAIKTFNSSISEDSSDSALWFEYKIK